MTDCGVDERDQLGGAAREILHVVDALRPAPEEAVHAVLPDIAADAEHGGARCHHRAEPAEALLVVACAVQQEQGARIARRARLEEVDVGLKRVGHDGAPARVWKRSGA